VWCKPYDKVVVQRRTYRCSSGSSADSFPVVPGGLIPRVFTQLCADLQGIVGEPVASWQLEEAFFPIQHFYQR